MSRIVSVKMSPEAYAVLDAMAEKAGVPLNEMCLRLLMTHPDVNKPELAKVPRGTMGRPRTRQAAAQAS